MTREAYDVDQERALEAQKMVEAWYSVWQRANSSHAMAVHHGTPEAARRAERVAENALEQLQAAQKHAERARSLWRPVRPGGGHQ